MKKLLSVFLTVLMFFSLAFAEGGQTGAAEKDEPVLYATDTYEFMLPAGWSFLDGDAVARLFDAFAPMLQHQTGISDEDMQAAKEAEQSIFYGPGLAASMNVTVTYAPGATADGVAAGMDDVIAQLEAMGAQDFSSVYWRAYGDRQVVCLDFCFHDILPETVVYYAANDMILTFTCMRMTDEEIDAVLSSAVIYGQSI